MEEQGSTRSRSSVATWISLAAAGLACGAAACESAGSLTRVVADTVVAAPGATGAGFGDPQKAVNGVRGGGDSAGSTDVFSLGYVAGGNDFLVLRWSGRRVQNGPGADLAVFENPFVIGNSSAAFLDPAIVSVSSDGTTWVEFPHAYVASDPTKYQADPSLWKGFAGITPVRWNVDTNDVPPFDQHAAGGDEFDLDDLPQGDAEADVLRHDGFRFVRIQSAATQVNPDTGVPYPHDPSATGPDIDGVAARYLAPDL